MNIFLIFFADREAEHKRLASFSKDVLELIYFKLIQKIIFAWTHPQNEFEYSLLLPLQFLFLEEASCNTLTTISIVHHSYQGSHSCKSRYHTTQKSQDILHCLLSFASQMCQLIGSAFFSGSFEFRYVSASVKILAQVLILEPNFSHLVLAIFCAFEPDFPPTAFQYIYFYFPYHERQSLESCKLLH